MPKLARLPLEDGGGGGGGGVVGYILDLNGGRVPESEAGSVPHTVTPGRRVVGVTYRHRG